MGKNCLEYTCPSHGGWGMVRTGMLVPESHQLFICPSACGRHGALGAVKQGFKKRLSYLYLEESDIVSGYDQAIVEAAGELFDRLGYRPKVLLVFVSCLDDLIGTDCDAVIEELSERYPDVKFRMCHMNPISGDSEEPPQKGIWKNMYSLLERESNSLKNRINMIGNLLPVHPDSELHTFLHCLGMEKVCQAASCTTYEEFRDMGNNCLNLVAAPFADRAAQLLKQREGMEYVNAFVSYDFEEIDRNYRAIAEKLKELGMAKEPGITKEPGMTKDPGMTAEETEGLPALRAEHVLEEARRKAEQAVKKAREIVGDQKLFLDYSAFVRPLKAARFLLEQGFQVAGVYLKEMDTEDPDYRWLEEHAEVELIKVNGPDMVNAWKLNGEGISIGAEAAYVTGSGHAAVMFQDEGLYGYYAVTRLMELLADAVREEIDLEKTIHQLGLVV
ncbi:MAG: oxidoreductase [Clostridium sp.]|nr:oxidoreductase [Clostridium sp.]